MKCARTACESQDAVCEHVLDHRWYCTHCADLINKFNGRIVRKPNEKWVTHPPMSNGVFRKDLPDRYALTAPTRNHIGYAEFDPGNVVMVGTHNECWIYLHKHGNHSTDYELKHNGWSLLPWSEDKFPACSQMVSHATQEDAAKHFEDCRKFYGADDHDIVLTAMREVDAVDLERGLKCRYTLSWMTYKGWKVYMKMTGCLASDPKYELKDEPA